MERNELRKAILECRLKIVRNAIEHSEDDLDKAYYEGKADGYQQAIALLDDSDMSMRVELEQKGIKRDKTAYINHKVETR